MLFLNNKMKFICISSAPLTCLNNITFGMKVWKKNWLNFSKVKFDYWIIGSFFFL